MPQVVGVFVATEAATADVFGIGVDDFVLAHRANRHNRLLDCLKAHPPGCERPPVRG
jgi:hypothetical protein